MKLQDRIAVVTGAGVGIGKVYAQRFVNEGAAVVVADVDKKATETAVADLESSGGAVRGVVADMADQADCERVVEQTLEAFGGVDILVNNAALHHGAFNQPPGKLDPADWQAMLAVNVTGPLTLARLVRASMAARGGGVIINQSSRAAYTLSSSYGVSKSTVNALTVALAVEFAEDNIRVNAVAPGMTDSESVLRDFDEEFRQRIIDQQLLKRQGRMSDMANMVEFLVSDEASFITGQVISVDGGSTLRV